MSGSFRSEGASNEDFPIDVNGRPTTRAAYRLLVQLFSKPGLAHDVMELAERIYVPPEDVELMCKQLESLDIVREQAPYSGKYLYNLQCINTSLQGCLESALLDSPQRTTCLNVP